MDMHSKFPETMRRGVSRPPNRMVLAPIEIWQQGKGRTMVSVVDLERRWRRMRDSLYVLRFLKHIFGSLKICSSWAAD